MKMENRLNIEIRKSRQGQEYKKSGKLVSRLDFFVFLKGPNSIRSKQRPENVIGPCGRAFHEVFFQDRKVFYPDAEGAKYINFA